MTHQQIKLAGSLWAQGKDTSEIASSLAVPESDIWNAIGLIKAHASLSRGRAA
jgi:hypothetical protein